ncbi:glucan endo-1,3-beta-glucosidase-like, partial [Ananas comosus]|uniref:Glucan endo-1,3-beta-glucosidase-like n=1 Tax=Ananas comosus TaxID=4615 RepID=A0A6P5EA06_ANACO
FAQIFGSVSGALAGTLLSVRNNCTYIVWPAVLTNPDTPSPPAEYSGFELPVQGTAFLHMPAGWSGLLWARTLCAVNSSGSFLCATADCRTGRLDCRAVPSAPVTLIEFSLGAAGGKNDAYDVSIAAGFNVPVSVDPPPRSPSCTPAACPMDVNAVCPPELQKVSGDGHVIACMSACQAFSDPADCCLGQYKDPSKCKPTKYGQMFKHACPMAVGYIYDNATRYCQGGSDYLVTFCPQM